MPRGGKRKNSGMKPKLQPIASNRLISFRITNQQETEISPLLENGESVGQLARRLLLKEIDKNK